MYSACRGIPEAEIGRNGYAYLFAAIVIFTLAACSLKSITTIPSDSTLLLNQVVVSGFELVELARPGDTITAKRIGHFDQTITVSTNRDRNPVIRLIPKSYILSISVEQRDFFLIVDGEFKEHSDGKQSLTYGNHSVVVGRAGYEPVSRDLFISEDTKLDIKLLHAGSRHEFLAQVDCGIWPKQVVFSRDAKHVYVPLLQDIGVNIIDTGNYRIELLPFSDQERNIGFSRGGIYVGFTEGIFNSAGDMFLVTQMTTNEIHVISYPDNVIKKTVSTGGNWSKVLTFSPNEQYLAVSNWSSNDISILDADSLELKKRLAFDATTPRGLAFTPDNSLLYIAYFGSGHIIAVSTETWESTHIFSTGGTNRDVIIDKSGVYAYVSNMQFGVVYVIDIEKNEIVRSIKVGLKPNTIRLTPDDRYLYVSCRGPNNPVNYELPSPEDGHIFVIATADHKVVEIIPAGNQPTGLDISPDGSLLAFSNFQDNTVEFYAIKGGP